MKLQYSIIAWLYIASFSSLYSQTYIDSLYDLVKNQSVGCIINKIDNGFIVIGHGVDTSPYNSIGSVFTSFNWDGSINFSTYTKEQAKFRQYYYQNSVIIDTNVYVPFVGYNPIQLVRFNLKNGQINFRKTIPNKAGGINGTFPYHLQLLDTNSILICSGSEDVDYKEITQFSIYHIQEDTFEFYFNSYPNYNQQLTDLEVTKTGYVLSGSMYNGDPWGSDFSGRSIIVWLDKNFKEVQRYVSPEGEYEQFGFDALLNSDGSIVATNCIGRKYFDGFYDYTGYRPSIHKIDAAGNLIWQRPMGRNLYLPWDYEFNCLIPSNTGDGYIAAGSQTNFGDSTYFGGTTTNEKGENLRFEAHIAKVSIEGDSLWSRWYYKADFLYSRSEFLDIIPHPEGGYLLCGDANKGPLHTGETVNYTWLLYVDEYGCAVPGCQNIVKSEDPALPDPIRLYPNPASNELYIYQQEDETIQYSVVNTSGQILSTFKSGSPGSTAILDVSQYPAGEYFVLKQDSKGRSRTEKWVKMN